jgi:hypothetical protein
MEETKVLIDNISDLPLEEKIEAVIDNYNDNKVRNTNIYCRSNNSMFINWLYMW